MLDTLISQLRTKPEEAKPNKLDDMFREFVGGMVSSGRLPEREVPKVTTTQDLISVLSGMTQEITPPSPETESDVSRASLMEQVSEIMAVVAAEPEPEVEASEILSSFIAEPEEKVEAIQLLTETMTALVEEVKCEPVVVAPVETVTRVEAEVSVGGLPMLVQEMRGLIAVIKSQVEAQTGKKDYKPLTGAKVTFSGIGNKEMNVEFLRGE